MSDAAKELGAQGGIIGGPARASVLAQKEIDRIARYGAYCRWTVGARIPFSEFL